MPFNKTHIRRLHSYFAPIMLLPVITTLITGSFFQIAVITGNSEKFLWLLEWHKGKFGRINLELIYPLLNSFGILILAITRIIMWFQTNRNHRIKKLN